MKALKEKRISLRSLWRRGLVILSLFALVFASCNTSGDDSGSSGPVDNGNVTDGRIVERVVFSFPEDLRSKGGANNIRNQYYGLPVDLTGVEATVYYHVPGGGEVKGETIKYNDEPNQFTVYPRIVEGSYKQDGTFDPYTGYRVICKKGGDSVAWPALGGTSYIKWITRDDTRDWNQAPVDNRSGNDPLLDAPAWRPTGTNPPGVPGYYDNGLQLTGPPGKTLTACVDDDTFDFSGLTLNASYNDNTWQKLDFDYVTWRVLPDYPAGKKDGVYPGYIYITVGDYPSAYDYHSYLGTIPANQYGITIRVPLAKVYTVTDIEVVMAGDTTKVTDYAFWEENTAGAWVARLIAAKASIKVNYTGSQASKTLAVEDINSKKRIWWNENPTEYPGNNGYAGRMLDFDVIPVAYPFTKKGNPDPLITVYYRGATDTIPVDVYTSLSGYDFEDLDIWDYHNPSNVRDNDIRYVEGMTEEQFVAAVKPVVDYTAYNSGKTKTYPLTKLIKKAVWVVGGVADDATNGYGLTYYTNYAEVVDKIKKDGVKKAVQITHVVNSAAVRTKLIELADTRYASVGTSANGAFRWVYTVKGHTFPYYDQVAGFMLPEMVPDYNAANPAVAPQIKNIWYNPKAYTLKYVNNVTPAAATFARLFAESPIFIFDAAAKTQKKKWNVNVVWETKVTVTN